MQVFQVRYRNTQGTLMRILNAVSRRGLDLPYVQAEPSEHNHQVTLLLEVNPKQVGQLCRDWHAVVDVLEVRPATALKEVWERGVMDALPPAPATLPAAARSAMA
jgi:acetolactate synthase small subunit